MTTIEQIKMTGAELVEKAARGEMLTKDELKLVEIANSLTSGKSFRAGKRKITKTGK